MPAELVKKKCKPCHGGMPPLEEAQVQALLKQVPGWSAANHAISRTFLFKNYDETVAFVNAVAWIARREDHHPEVEFAYKSCRVRYTTHAIRGLSENDFICAAKVDALLA
jgi:4a-hydroxytetrahydrobiopterin dehydratase